MKNRTTAQAGDFTTIRRNEMIIRDEIQADLEAISGVTEVAFRTLQVSNHTEQFIIKALRDSNALTVSLVAEIDGEVLGHVAFSPVSISDGSEDWYGLGPITVLPDFQRRGIGKVLIKEGLSRLRALGGKGCALVGDPAFYQRFGFRNNPALEYAGIPPEYFLVLPLDGDSQHGAVAFHEAFMARPE